MKNIILTYLFFIGFLYAVNAQETINVMFYNLLEFPDAPPSNRSTILKTIVDDYNPDLFMVCELKSEEGATAILNTSLQTSDNRYLKANFVSNQSNSQTDLQQLVFYNSKKLILENQDLINTGIRDINHYLFKLNTTVSTPVYLDVFVAHLKSSQGSTNEQKRLNMVLDFTSTLATIPSNHFVMIAGDFNLYTAQEDAYQELLDPTNAIVLKDPINRPGKWHLNSNFQDIHTQSTRKSNVAFDGFGAGGDLDDRFDFILISKNLENSSILKYVTNSYKAYGNNGNCYNKSINDPTCNGTEYNTSVRDALYNMSDHLPVVLQLETSQALSVGENNFTKSYIQFATGNLISDNIRLIIDSSIINYKMDVYNSMGQKIKTIILDKNNKTIDVTYLPAGVYYIKLQNANSALKFIKQ